MKFKSKKIMGIVLAFTMTFASAVPAMAAGGNAFVRCDGLLYNVENKTINTGGSVLIESNGFFNMVNIMNPTVDESNSFVSFTYANKNVTVTAGSNIAVVDGEDVEMTAAAIKEGDLLYLPIKSLAEICGSTVSWDQKTGTVVIDTPNSNYSVYNNMEKATYGSGFGKMTFKDAVNKANNKTATIKKMEESLDDLEKSIEDADDEYKDLKDKYRGTSWDADQKAWEMDNLQQKIDEINAKLKEPAPESDDPLASITHLMNQSALTMELQQLQQQLAAMQGDIQATVAENALENIEKTLKQREIFTYENSLKKSKISIEQLKDANEYMVFNMINGIKSAEYGMVTLKKQIELKEEEVRRLELKFSLGMESESAITAAKKELEQNNTELKNMEITLDNLRANLNNTIGVHAASPTSVNLPEEKQYVEPGKINMYIESSIKNSPDLSLLELDIKEAEYNLNTHKKFTSSEKDTIKDMTGETESKLERTLENLKMDYNAKKLDIEKTIRTAYNNILANKETYEKDKLEYSKAIDAYDNAVVAYQTGGVTFYELQQAEMALLASEIKLQQDRLDAANYQYAYANPHVTGQGQ